MKLGEYHSEIIPLVADATAALQQYLALAGTLDDIDENIAPSYISKLLTGLNHALVYNAKAVNEYNQAKIIRKEIEGRVALEDYIRHLDGAKGTEAMREAFINKHPDVVAARMREAEFEAAVEYLQGIKQSLVMTISAAKAIVYGYKSSEQFHGRLET